MNTTTRLAAIALLAEAQAALAADTGDASFAHWRATCALQGVLDTLGFGVCEGLSPNENSVAASRRGLAHVVSTQRP